MASSERTPVLQVLRAVAALSVAQTQVVAIQSVHEIGRACVANVVPGIPRPGAVGVDLFFVVSGLLCR